jgi:signal peptidase I
MGARWVVLLVVALVATGLALFVFDFPRPASDDMAPNVHKGDLLFACRVCGAPRRGDVVLFSPPDGNGLTVRRVVGIPGDKIEVRGGVTLVNGQPLPWRDAGTLALGGAPLTLAVETNGAHQYRVARDDGTPLAGERKAATLGDQYFLLADRRTRARDSRDYGPVAHGAVRSIVLRILRAGDGDASRPRRIP